MLTTVLLGASAYAQTGATTTGGHDVTLGDKVEAGIETTREGARNAADWTRRGATKGWEATREGTANAAEWTREKSGEAWDATKSGTARAVDWTREISGEAWHE